MSKEPPIYDNMAEAPIYGNLDDFSNIETDEDFEAAAARLDLPVLPPKPQKRASWFQGKSINIKDKAKKKTPQNENLKKKKKKVVRKRKEYVEIPELPSQTGKHVPSSHWF